MRALAILSLRGEGAFLPKWQAHHRDCGFTGSLICSDVGTDRTPDHFAKAGLSP